MGTPLFCDRRRFGSTNINRLGYFKINQEEELSSFEFFFALSQFIVEAGSLVRSQRKAEFPIWPNY
jgi:hypothetical protein